MPPEYAASAERDSPMRMSSSANPATIFTCARGASRMQTPVCFLGRRSQAATNSTPCATTKEFIAAIGTAAADARRTSITKPTDRSTAKRVSSTCAPTATARWRRTWRNRESQESQSSLGIFHSDSSEHRMFGSRILISSLSVQLRLDFSSFDYSINEGQATIKRRYPEHTQRAGE